MSKDFFASISQQRNAHVRKQAISFFQKQWQGKHLIPYSVRTHFDPDDISTSGTFYVALVIQIEPNKVLVNCLKFRYLFPDLLLPNKFLYKTVCRNFLR